MCTHCCHISNCVSKIVTVKSIWSKTGAAAADRGLVLKV